MTLEEDAWRSSRENGPHPELAHSNLVLRSRGRLAANKRSINRFPWRARIGYPLRTCRAGAGGRNGGGPGPPYAAHVGCGARLTRCLYRGMYNNRLRRWHRYPFVSVGGHLGFPSAAYRRRGGGGRGFVPRQREGREEVEWSRQDREDHMGKAKELREINKRERKRERVMRERILWGAWKGTKRYREGILLE